MTEPLASIPFLKIPFYPAVSAGFPIPVEPEWNDKLNLNAYLIPHPEATFFVRASGDSMRGAGIISGDILIVDRSRKAKNRDIVVACVNGDFLVKRWIIRSGQNWLIAANPDYPEIRIHPEMDFELWGVVSSVIHEFK